MPGMLRTMGLSCSVPLPAHTLLSEPDNSYISSPKWLCHITQSEINASWLAPFFPVWDRAAVCQRNRPPLRGHENEQQLQTQWTYSISSVYSVQCCRGCTLEFMAARWDRLFNKARVRAALHLGQVTPPSSSTPPASTSSPSPKAERKKMPGSAPTSTGWRNQRAEDVQSKKHDKTGKLQVRLAHFLWTWYLWWLAEFDGAQRRCKPLCFFSWLRPSGIFRPGSANVGNSAAIETPGSADTAVEQIRLRLIPGPLRSGSPQTALRTQRALSERRHVSTALAVVYIWLQFYLFIYLVFVRGD